MKTENLLLVGLAAIFLLDSTTGQSNEQPGKYPNPGGKSRGLRNNNPGNIKETGTSWKGQIKPTNDPPFAQFQNMVFGTRAMIILIKRTYRNLGVTTIRKIIERYAPEIENPTGNYIRFVSQKTGIDPDAVLSTESDYKKVIQSMANFENGVSGAIPDAIYFEAQKII